MTRLGVEHQCVRVVCALGRYVCVRAYVCAHAEWCCAKGMALNSDSTFASCVVSAQSLSLSEPQFPHPKMGLGILPGLLWGLSNTICDRSSSEGGSVPPVKLAPLRGHVCARGPLRSRARLCGLVQKAG